MRQSQSVVPVLTIHLRELVKCVLSLTDEEEINQEDGDFWSQEHTDVVQEQDEGIQECGEPQWNE